MVGGRVSFFGYIVGVEARQFKSGIGVGLRQVNPGREGDLKAIVAEQVNGGRIIISVGIAETAHRRRHSDRVKQGPGSGNLGGFFRLGYAAQPDVTVTMPAKMHAAIGHDADLVNGHVELFRESDGIPRDVAREKYAGDLAAKCGGQGMLQEALHIDDLWGIKPIGNLVLAA